LLRLMVYGVGLAYELAMFILGLNRAVRMGLLSSALTESLAIFSGRRSPLQRRVREHSGAGICQAQPRSFLVPLYYTASKLAVSKHAPPASSSILAHRKLSAPTRCLEAGG
jgi:hypothetical protein